MTSPVTADTPIPAESLRSLLNACREIASMKTPTVEHILRRSGYGFEADRIADVVLAIEAIDAHNDAD